MNVLAFFAHPDDETMMAGGTLARLVRSGLQVHYYSATRGEGGEVGEPPRCTREQLGDVREQELVRAVGALGGKSLTFLGYVDPTVGPDNTLSAPKHDPVMLAGQIVNSIKQFAPEVVITHGSDGEYGHPAHKGTHAAVLAAVASLAESALLVYSFAAAYPSHPYPRLANANDAADVVVDVSAFLNQKEAAALCHATQTALFVRRRSEQAGHKLSVREVLLTEESFHRHWPAAPLADDAFLQWLNARSVER
jgi:LmbE family N-acetylglucosaminyl deacetylase